MTSGTTISATLRNAVEHLRRAGVENPRLDAEVLLRFVLGLDRTQLFLRLNEPIASDAADRYRALIERRAEGEPVAYLTGAREFYGLPFRVTPAVLIPRPETELLVESALGWLARTSSPSPIVLDIGTGSGAIALSVASQQPLDWTGLVIAADVSAEALAVARENLRQIEAHLGTPAGLDRVRFVRGSLAAWFGGRADVILANLPYLRDDQVRDEPSIQAEPELALLGGDDDGLALIRALIADLPRVLAPHGAVALELDPSQAETVADLLEETLPGAEVVIHADLAGLARFVTADLSGTAHE